MKLAIHDKEIHKSHLLAFMDVNKSEFDANKVKYSHAVGDCSTPVFIP